MENYKTTNRQMGQFNSEMMKHIKLIGLLALMWVSCSKKNEDVSDITKHQILMPIVEGDEDTITNGEIFRTKVYLTSDSLYQVALSNGVADYLDIRYEEHRDTSDYFSKSAKVPELVGDTAFIEFKVNIPDLKTGEIVEHNWQVDFNVNFKPDSNPFDTSFVYHSRIFVKGN